jgi:DnaJ-class molecular chaperone
VVQLAKKVRIYSTGESSTIGLGGNMQKNAGKKKEKCKNCEGKGTLKKGDKVVRCQRCDGTGIKR